MGLPAEWNKEYLIRLENAGGVLTNGYVPLPLDVFFDPTLEKLKAALPMVDSEFLEKWQSYVIAKQNFEQLFKP